MVTWARRGTAWLVLSTSLAGNAWAQADGASSPSGARDEKPPDAPPQSAEPTAAAAEPAAESAPAAPELVPVLHHAPVTIAPAHHPLLIKADLQGPELVRVGRVVYRLNGDARDRVVELRRSPGEEAYVAEIPARDVTTPSLAYCIELELVNGRTLAAFSSRAGMHHVSVPEDYLDLREAALNTRLHGRRNVVSTRAEYVSFTPFGASNEDRYWQAEAAFTHRPLRSVTEFTVKAGALRGTTPAFVGQRDTGMYYTAPVVRFRLVDAVHVDVEALTGVTQSGFELGGGAEILFGDPYGSKLAVGVESIHDFGTRLWSRVDITATERIIVSPIVEATNFPYAESFGVRLLLNAGFELGGGVLLNLRGGYQAREMASGGPSAGLGLSVGF